MALINNITASFNHTNQTELSGMDILELDTWVEQFIFCQKIIIIFIAILTVLGNSLVLIVTWRKKSLHQPNKYFIACLAFADLLVGLFVAPLLAYQLNQLYRWREETSIHLCRFLVWIDIFSLTTSIYILTFISVDRYLKISKPLQYKSRMTTSTSLKIILVIVLFSISLATYTASPHSGCSGILDTGYGTCSFRDGLNKVRVFFLFLAISVFILPAIIILIMYAFIFLLAHKRNKMLANGKLGRAFDHHHQQTALRQDMKVIRMLLVVFGVFIFCWGPWFTWTLSWYRSADSVDGDLMVIDLIFRTLPLFNSLCNPIIYACLDRTYREAFEQLFMCQRFRMQSDVSST